MWCGIANTDRTAGIKCVVWNSQLPKLAQMPVTGEQIIILGSIRVYPQRGEYQLSVWQTLPAGVGLQALRYQQLKNRLLAEGLFDAQRKRSLPTHPQTIAVSPHIPKRSLSSLHQRLLLGVIFKKLSSKGIQVYTFYSLPLQYKVSKHLNLSSKQLIGWKEMAVPKC